MAMTNSDTLHIETTPMGFTAYYDPEGFHGDGAAIADALQDLLEQTDEAWRKALDEKDALRRSIADAISYQEQQTKYIARLEKDRGESAFAYCELREYAENSRKLLEAIENTVGGHPNVPITLRVHGTVSRAERLETAIKTLRDHDAQRGWITKGEVQALYAALDSDALSIQSNPEDRTALLVRHSGGCFNDEPGAVLCRCCGADLNPEAT